jgi:hypothetical protein
MEQALMLPASDEKKNDLFELFVYSGLAAITGTLGAAVSTVKVYELNDEFPARSTVVILSVWLPSASNR